MSTGLGSTWLEQLACSADLVVDGSAKCKLRGLICCCAQALGMLVQCFHGLSQLFVEYAGVLADA